MSLKRKLCILFLFILILFICLVVFLKILKNERLIVQLEDRKYNSYLLIDKFRQTTDDFDNLAKSYGVTGDSRFREAFHKNLNHYMQQASFAKRYRDIYWNPALDSNQKTEPEKDIKYVFSGALVNKVNLTRDAALIRKAEIQLRNLLQLENQAVNAMTAFYQDKKGHHTLQGSSNQKMAIKWLYSQKHYDLKKEMMQLLAGFFESIEKRTIEDISFYQDKSNRLSVVLMTIVILSALLLFISVFLNIDSSSRQIRIIEEAKERSIFSRGKIWIRAGWPFILSSFIIICVIASLAWWFYLELISIGSYQVKNSITNNFKGIYNNVVHWMDQTNQEALFLAETGK